MYTKVSILYVLKFSKILPYTSSSKSSGSLYLQDPNIDEGLFLSLSLASLFSKKSLSTRLILLCKSPSIPFKETKILSKSKSIPAWIVPAKEELITAVGPPDWPIRQFIKPPYVLFTYTSLPFKT